MSSSLNKVLLIGNIGRDPETEYSQSGNLSITKFSLATNRNYKKNDEWVNEVEWHRIIAYNLSDYLKENLKKGSKVFVEGRLRYNEFEKDGQKIKYTDIVANDVQLLDRAEGNVYDKVKPELEMMPVKEEPDTLNNAAEADEEIPF